jgi:hypothetical protein
MNVASPNAGALKIISLAPAIMESNSAGISPEGTLALITITFNKMKATAIIGAAMNDLLFTNLWNSALSKLIIIFILRQTDNSAHNFLTDRLESLVNGSAAA